MSNEPQKKNKGQAIKQIFGSTADDAPYVTVKHNIITPVSSLISHKYTFILEALIDFNTTFTFADFTNNNGLFASLIAQDFNNARCTVVSQNPKNLQACKQVQEMFKLSNLTYEEADLFTTASQSDITLHENATIMLLKKYSAKKLAKHIATTTQKQTIVEIPSATMDIASQTILADKFEHVNTLLAELLYHFLLVTYIPIIYNPTTVRAYYLLEKR